MVKVGDKIRILIDGADHANVQCGDEFVVGKILEGSCIEVEGVNKWRFYPGCYEVIHATPPQKITQNGYEYELVGPVKPEWLVDGAWVVNAVTEHSYQIIEGEPGLYRLKRNGKTPFDVSLDRILNNYRPHTASDWKWGDWAMYDGKRVFVVGGVDNTGRVLVSYPDIYPLGRNNADRNFLFIPSEKLTPTF